MSGHVEDVTRHVTRGHVRGEQWNDSSIDGYGVSYTKANVYQGRLHGSQPSGRGVMTTSSGLVYAGEWDQGLSL